MSESLDTLNLSKKQRKQLQASLQNRQKRLNQAKIIAVVLVALGLFGFWYSRTRVPVSQNNINKSPAKLYANDHLKGNPDSKIILVEYADFQCPACAAYSPLVQELVDLYQDEIVFVYRHFPLKQIHFQAEIAAQASEAAAKQGKFWEMYHLLYSRQSEWAEKRTAKELFINYAQELGLNVNQFKNDLTSDSVKAKVKEDYLNALSLSLNGTPTFFLQGQKIDNPSNLENFKQLLAKAGVSIKTASSSATLNSTPSAAPTSINSK